MITRLKISLILAPLVLLLVIGVYIYSLWAAERQKTNDLPVEAVSKMMSDLLKFHEKRGGFPSDLKQLEGVVWQPKETRVFSNGNRTLSHRNYLYLYSRQNPHRFTLWALPTGRFRDEAPTWFLAVSPSMCRRWKGSAMELNDVGRLTTQPSQGQLGVLGLIEQEKLVFEKSTGGQELNVFKFTKALLAMRRKFRNKNSPTT